MSIEERKYAPNVGAKGDAGARTHASIQIAWDNDDLTVGVGTDDKAVAPETVLFLRYDLDVPTDLTLPTIPANAIARACQFQLILFSSPIAPDGEGKIRVGMLDKDGVWDHPSSVGWEEGVAAHQYEFSYLLPFPTGPGTDTINLGVLFLNLFFTDPWVYLNGVPVGGGGILLGDKGFEPTPVDHVFSSTQNDMAVLINTWRGDGRGNKIAYVFDGFEIPTGVTERVNIDTEDFGLNFGVQLFIQWEVPSGVKVVGLDADC